MLSLLKMFGMKNPLKFKLLKDSKTVKAEKYLPCRYDSLKRVYSIGN
jgi:hypothetical protein